MTRRMPAHGTRARHQYWGCRCDDCREADRIYLKRLKTGRLVSAFTNPVGTVRRLRGLAHYGFTFARVASELGTHDEWVSFLARDKSGSRGILATTARDVQQVCDRLARLDPPVGRSASYARGVARKRGWYPLAAWDDIDDPDAVPMLGGDGRDIVDEVAIRRVLNGEARYSDLTPLERKTLIRAHRGRVPNLCNKIGMSGAQYNRWVRELCEDAA